MVEEHYKALVIRAREIGKQIMGLVKFVFFQLFLATDATSLRLSPKDVIVSRLPQAKNEMISVALVLIKSEF